MFALIVYLSTVYASACVTIVLWFYVKEFDSFLVSFYILSMRAERITVIFLASINMLQ